MKPHYLFALMLFISLLSCTKEVDFNQVDDISVKTSYIVTLVHLNLEAPKFLNEFNDEINFSSDYIATTIDDSGKDYLKKVVFTLITENSFRRSFSFNIQFYDIEGNTIYQLQPTVYINETSSPLTTLLEIPTEDLHFLYEAQFFGFNLVLNPTTENDLIFDMNTFGALNIKSSMELFFNFKKV